MIVTRQGRLSILFAVIVIARWRSVSAEPAGTSVPDAEGDKPTAPEGARRRAALDQALRLAEALHDEDALLELYARKATRRNIASWFLARSAS